MKLILLLTLILFTRLGFAQLDYVPTLVLDQEDGLEQQTVKTLAEDALGQIWIGTQLGLQYWNGQQLEKYEPVKSAVQKLFARDSIIFCVSIKTIFKINIYSQKVVSFELHKPDYYQCLTNDFGIGIVNSSFTDTLLFDYNLEKLEWPEWERLHGSKILQKPTQINFDQGQLQLNHTKALFIGADTLRVTQSYNSTALKYGAHRAFIAAQEGLVELNGEKDAINTKVILKNQRIECLLIDKNKNLWVGTAGRGLFLYHRQALENSFYPVWDEKGKKATCWAFIQSDNHLYVASSKGLINLDSDEVDPIEELTKDLFCFSGIQCDGFILVGTLRSGIYKIQEGRVKQVYFNKEEVLDNTVVQFVKNEKGILASTKEQWIQFDDAGNFMATKSFSILEEDAYVMSLQPTGTGYLTATTRGLHEYNKNLEILRSYKHKAARVFSMVDRYKEEWWCASMDAGLFKIVNDSLENQHFEDDKLLGLKSVNQTLWINSFNQVYAFDSLGTRSFSIQNGFPLSEYNQLGIHVDKAKNIYFAGVGGVFKFDTQNVSAPLSMPSWSINFAEQYLADGSEISINYGQTQIEIEANAIMLSDQNRYELAYKTAGDWVPFSNYSTLKFEIDFGREEIAFRIRNSYSGEELVHTIYVNRAQPFWLSFWFFALIAILGLMALFGLYFLVQFIKTRRLLKLEEEERKITQERLRISRELHDNIGARLTHIISSLDIELYKRKENDEQIGHINSFAKETMVQLRETIWAVGEGSIFFSELAARIEQYAHQSNKMTEIEITFSNEVNKDFELNSTQTINYYRIIQEAINNAIKYSGANHIWINFNQQQEKLLMIIKDDGIGFDLENAHAGSGLLGMKNRATEAGGACDIQSKVGQGTTIEITCQIK